jgi:geranylgeranyl diphosphate synthase type I
MNDKMQTFLTAIDEALHQALEQANIGSSYQLHEILAYHMGWQGNHSRSEIQGKRFRPMLVLLSCSAAGGDWHNALPAAAAVELVHNFSLIHDDIEDNSPIRRGRPSVWKKWGIPQAINAGDAMFTLAHLQSIRLANKISQSVAIKAVELLQQACLHLTQGQYLDLAFEKRDDVTIDDYWSMVDGKTAALISAAAELGALSALCDEPTCQVYRNFGRLLGKAFQVQDDYLGIWGNTSLTGKSNQSDLLTRKKTLPVLYALSIDGKFSQQWKREPEPHEDIDGLARMLELEGAREFTLAEGDELISQAIAVLAEAHPTGLGTDDLLQMAHGLSSRQV